MTIALCPGQANHGSTIAYMSAPPQLFVEIPEDVFDPELDALEVIGDTAPVSSSFTADAQDTSITFQIPANKVRSALRSFLGYSYADGAAPYSLHRELPARHPKYPNLYAYSASITEFGPKPNPDNPRNETYIESPFEGSDGETMWYAGYNKALLSVKYKSWGRVRFLPDSDIGDYRDEYKRYCDMYTEPSMESLQADGSSQLKFAEHCTPAQGIGSENDPYGKPFPAPIAELMGKTALSIRIFQCPMNYISTDPDILLLDKWLGRPTLTDDPDDPTTWKYPPRLGTINSEPFLGFRTGEVLLRAVKADPILFPVTTADPYDLATGFNLTGVWEYFAPHKGKAFGPTNTATASPYLGHRLYPWARSGRWYVCTRDGLPDGPGMLPMTNHWKVFQSVLDDS
jgi:hypothetical protein